MTNDRQNNSRELSSLGAQICEELSGGKRSDQEWQVETAGKQISAPIVKDFLTPRAAHKNEWVDPEAGSSPRLEEIPKSNGWVGVDDNVPFQPWVCSKYTKFIHRDKHQGLASKLLIKPLLSPITN